MQSREIPGFPGYFANENGTITSKSGNVMYGASRKSNKMKYARFHKQVKIGKKKYYMHRLIAMAWVENPRPDIFLVVDHIDQNELNNKPYNLRWLNRRLNSLNSCTLNASFNKRTRKWESRVYQRRIGVYDTFREAYLKSKCFKNMLFELEYTRLTTFALCDKLLHYVPFERN